MGGDGMCCGENGDGGYKLTLGDALLQEGGDFEESDSLWFDVGPPKPSHAPTPAPICIQEGGACNPTLGVNCCSGRCGNNVCHSQTKRGLIITVLLGIYFTCLQALEYYEARF